MTSVPAYLQDLLPPPTQPPLSPIATFVDWLVSVGVKINGVEIHEFTQSMRGLVATRDLRATEWVLKIPLAATVHGGLPVSDPALSRVKHLFNNNVLLALVLLSESRSPRSRLRPYLDVLPRSLRNFPLFYNETELRMLNGTFLLGILCGLIVDRPDHELQGAPQGTISETGERGAENCVRGRVQPDVHLCIVTAVRDRDQRDTSVAYDSHVRYPRVAHACGEDMMNAQSDRGGAVPSAEIAYSASEDLLVVFATQNVRKGQEVSFIVKHT